MMDSASPKRGITPIRDFPLMPFSINLKIYIYIYIYIYICTLLWQNLLCKDYTYEVHLRLFKECSGYAKSERIVHYNIVPIIDEIFVKEKVMFRGI